MTFNCAAITGASSGIGRSIALKMVREGISVAMLARRLNRLEELAAELKEINPRVKIFQFQGDIREKNSVETFLSECEKSLGKVDIFFNNAGIAFDEPFTNLSSEQVEDLVGTNFTGSIWSIYHAMQIFEKRKKGVLVNISSTTVLKPSPQAPLYSATKLGVTGLVRALEEKYLTEKDIKIINVIPGPTLTELISDRIKDLNKESLISPDDIAHWAWLAINSPKNCKVSNLVLRNSGEF